jgi:hypothetical protein
MASLGPVTAPAFQSHTFEKWDRPAAEAIFGKDIAQAKLVEIAKGMIRDIDGVRFTVKIKAELIPVYQGMTQTGSTPKVTFTFRGDEPGSNPTYLSRSFVRDEYGTLVVKHNSFEKGNVQPAGFGKDMLRGHMLTYERLGVGRVETFANIDVGAYAWAKYGFAALDIDGAARVMDDLTEAAHRRTVYNQDKNGHDTGKGTAITDDVARQMKRIAGTRSRFAIWEFADLTVDGVKVGKALLTNEQLTGSSNGWDAFLNVKGDDEGSKRQRERFWSYVGRTKQPKTRAAGKAREARVVMETVKAKKEPGELCQWNGTSYEDRPIWDEMLDGDTRNFYELNDPASRAAYKAQLPMYDPLPKPMA